MGEELRPAVIKKTQDTLGKYIKRPPLTEKLLRKPPFRFLHDVVTTVVRETKFLDGLFTVEEMNSEFIVDKESKMAFLQKVIDVVNISCGVSLSVRPAKIVAGYEPEKTNELLQLIGKAIEKKVDSSVAVHRVLSKAKGSRGSEQPMVKSHPKKEEQVKMKKTGQQVHERKAKEKAVSDASKPKIGKEVKEGGGGEGEREKRLAAANREKIKKPRISLKDNEPKKNEETIVTGNVKAESKTKATPRERRSVVEDEGGVTRRRGRSGQVVERRSGKGGGLANTSSHDAAAAVIKETGGGGEDCGVVAEAVAAGGTVEEEDVVVPSKKKLSLDGGCDVPEEEAFAVEGQMLFPPEMSGDCEGQDEVAVKVDGDIVRSGSHKKRQPMLGEDEDSTRLVQQSRVAISTPMVRPSSVASRALRPRSSRPHAPRLRSALGGLIPATEGAKGSIEEVQVVVATHGDDVDDAAEFVVEEARPPLAPMRQGGGRRAEEEGVGIEQQGLLVTKILETKKELEESSGGGGGQEEGEGGHVVEYAGGDERQQRGGQHYGAAAGGRVESVRCTVQAIARAAHPLGSLVAVLHEVVDAMRSEASGWRAESERLMKVLGEQQRQMELELEPLYLVLADVEQRVLEERENVSAAKVRVLKAERRIHAMLDPKGSGPVQTARGS